MTVSRKLYPLICHNMCVCRIWHCRSVYTQHISNTKSRTIILAFLLTSLNIGTFRCDDGKTSWVFVKSVPIKMTKIFPFHKNLTVLSLSRSNVWYQFCKNFVNSDFSCLILRAFYCFSTYCGHAACSWKRHCCRHTGALVMWQFACHDVTSFFLRYKKRL